VKQCNYIKSLVCVFVFMMRKTYACSQAERKKKYYRHDGTHL
jgi:hypothetical protein